MATEKDIYNEQAEGNKAYIEWYNTKRIKLKLDGMSPVEYRIAKAA